MSGITPQTAARSRWMDWQPKAHVLAKSAEGGPTKPSELSSLGFEGVMPGDSPTIQLLPQRANLAGARERGASWAAWKAAALNRLFQEQGVTGQPSRIMAATVEDGQKNGFEKVKVSD